jgi:hypothetical protein
MLNDLEQKLKENPVSEMIDNLPQIFKDSYDDIELPGEAIAEFTRMYLLKKSDAQVFGSKFYNEFEGKLSKSDFASLQRANSDIGAWYAQDIEEKIGSTMQSKTRVERASAAHLKRVWYQAAFSEFNPFDEFMDLVRESTGGEVPLHKDLYKMALNTKGSTMQALTIVSENLVNPEGEVVGDSFSSLFEGLEKKDWDTLNRYMKSKHALDWMDQGKKVFNDSISYQEIKDYVDDIEQNRPELVEIAEGVYSWWSKFIKAWVVDTGLLEESVYKKLMKKYPHYVPLYRIMDRFITPEQVGRRGIKKGFSDIKSPIKRASKEGSTLDTGVPIEEFVNDIHRIVQTIKRREVMLILNDWVDPMNKDSAEGLSFFVRKLPTKINSDPFNMIETKYGVIYELVKDRIEALPQTDRDMFYKLNMKEAIEYIVSQDWEESAEIVDRLIDDVLFKFIPEKVSKETNVVGVIDRNGKYNQFEIFDPLFLKALLSLSRQELPAWLKVFQTITRLRKNLITGGNPIFGVVSNMPRDFVQALIAGGYKNPVKFIEQYITSIYDVLANTENLKTLHSSGGGNASRYSTDRDMMKEMLNVIVPGRRGKNPVGTLLSAVEQFNDLIETMARLPEFKRFDLSTYEGRMQALYAYNDVTVNFQRRGTMAYSLDPLLFFYNTGMQGLDKVYRMGFKDKNEFWSRLFKALMVITVPMIIQQVLLWNDEDYKMLSEYIKDHYYVIKNPLARPGDPPFIKKPLNRELGVLFHSTLRRTMNAIATKDPAAFKGFEETIYTNFLPPVSPILKIGDKPMEDTIFGPFEDIALNRDFKNTPIVSGAISYKPAELQSDDTTSEIAKKLAQFMALVPNTTPVIGSKNFKSRKKLDYLLQQYSGVLGQVLLPAFTKSKGALGVLDGIARRVTADPAYSNDILNEFYGYRDSMESERQTFKSKGVEEPEDHRSLRLFYVNVSDQFTEYRKNIDAIEADKSISDQERKKRIRYVRMNIVVAADRVNRDYKTYLESIK